jgi:hypothetical protein
MAEKKRKSSTKIGGAWCGVTEETNKEFISIKINEELLPFTIPKNTGITLWAREITSETHENAPQYDVCISVYEPKEK